MKDINGITVLEEGDNHADFLPEGLSLPIFEGLHAPYGFKTTVYDDKLVWTPGTEEDYRNAVAQKLGINPSQVDRAGCSSYPCGDRCGSYNAQRCHPEIQNGPGKPFWYCHCGT
ncbi:MAG TPA: hypothetical protein VF865_06650 [Acidobacteriaceae bacterium]